LIRKRLLEKHRYKYVDIEIKIRGVRVWTRNRCCMIGPGENGKEISGSIKDGGFLDYQL
jgi:hypothetical protein